jgi:APA family basic amino acid/polyamine antiporter
MEQRTSLSKTMSKTDVFALAFGAMIGWGWVVLANNWLEMGGPLGTTVAFSLGALMCVVVSLVYAELTSAMPVAGGPVAFTYRGLGPKWSWVTGWILTLAYVSVAAWESVAITAALDYIVPLPKLLPLWTIAGEQVYLTWCVPGLVFTMLITYLNVRGTRLSVLVQSAATSLLLVAGILFVVVSALKGNTDNVSPVWVSTSGMASVLMMVPFMMVGFDVIPQSAEETRLPHRSIGRLLVVSVLAAAVWYVAITWGLAYAAPSSVRNSSQLAVSTAMGYMLGSPLWGNLLALGGICGILTSWNAFIVAGSRVVFGMARARMLPRELARVNANSGSPVNALALMGGICALAPFLGTNTLSWLANVGGFCTCITYLLVSVSFVRLRRIEPHMPRPFRAGKSAAGGALASIITAVFLSLYLPIGPSSLDWPYEWTIVAAWTFLGLVCYRLSRRASDGVTTEERSYLLFGETIAETQHDTTPD